MTVDKFAEALAAFVGAADGAGFEPEAIMAEPVA